MRSIKHNYTLDRNAEIQLPTNIYTLEIILTALHKAGISEAERVHNSWKNSTDGSYGAAFHYEVEPIRETAKEIKAILNKFLPEDNQFGERDYAGIKVDPYTGEKA